MEVLTVFHEKGPFKFHGKKRVKTMNHENALYLAQPQDHGQLSVRFSNRFATEIYF